MRRHSTILALLVSLTAFAGTANAQAEEKPEPTIEVDLSVTLVSDYRFRGVSLTDFKPAVQPDLTVRHKSGLYVNFWGSNVTENDGADLEADVSIGWSREFGDTSVDLRAMYYMYPGASSLNYAEVSATLGRTLGKASVAANVSYVPRQANTGDMDNIYVGLSGEVPLGNSPVTLKGAVGYENGAFGEDKVDWLVGAGVDLGKGFAFDLSYVDTANSGGLREARAGVVAGLSKEF